MKRIVLLMSALAVLLGLTTGTASAAPISNCLGKVLHSANYVRLTNGSGVSVGAIQLCRDGDYWFALYIHDYPMQSGRKVQAFLYSYINGAPYGKEYCEVTAGETWCRTPMIYGQSPSYTFKAHGIYYAWQNGQWVKIGEGVTKRCNKYVGCV